MFQPEPRSLNSAAWTTRKSKMPRVFVGHQAAVPRIPSSPEITGTANRRSESIRNVVSCRELGKQTGAPAADAMLAARHLSASGEPSGEPSGDPTLVSQNITSVIVSLCLLFCHCACSALSLPQGCAADCVAC